MDPERTRQKPNSCYSPHCHRDTDEGEIYCCPMCEVLRSETDDYWEHWEYCNLRYSEQKGSRVARKELPSWKIERKIHTGSGSADHQGNREGP